MKLISFYHDGREGYGAVKDDGIVDLSGAMYEETHFANLKSVFAAGDGALVSLKKTAAEATPTFGMNDVTVRLPIHNPSKIFCVGRNYYAYHEVMEDGRPEWPSIFPRFRDSFSAHDEATNPVPDTAFIGNRIAANIRHGIGLLNVASLLANHDNQLAFIIELI